MHLSLEQVRHVAQLARLRFSAEDEVKFQAQLSRILDAIESLSALDTSAVEPTLYLNVSTDERNLREDVVGEHLGAERAVANAPAKVGTSFAVPRIIE